MKTAHNGENPTLERNKINAMSFYAMAVNAQRPTEAIETYTSGVYKQHNPNVGDDPKGFVKHFIDLNNLIPHVEDFRRVIAEDDLVAMHVLHICWPSTYVPAPGEKFDFERDAVVSFDLFRLNEDGKVIEHWDAMQYPPTKIDLNDTFWDQRYWEGQGWPPVPTEIVGPHTMVSGPRFVTDRDKTGENKALVKSFVESVLVGGDLDKLPDYFDGNRCIQHNPFMDDGVDDLQGICGSTLQPHALRLAYAANSTLARFR